MSGTVDGHRVVLGSSTFVGYLFGALLMLVAAFVAARFAVRAERQPLEVVARPLTAVD